MTSVSPKKRRFLCSGARTVRKTDVRLDYQGVTSPLVRLKLPKFVEDVLHIDARCLDLLELAAYVHSADRIVSRGSGRSVLFNGWERTFEFRVKVRDVDFWQREDVCHALSRALTFMTGDREYVFRFEGGHKTPRVNLFDVQGVAPSPPTQSPEVMPFSGGLDSLCGALRALSNGKYAMLVSHQSSPRAKHAQRRVVEELKQKFPGRVQHYQYECHLRGRHAVDETQRTRAFLYLSIAAVVAHTYGQESVTVCENGVTSINLPRREDLMNARASRTTHPKTLAAMESLFQLVFAGGLRVMHPLFGLTKAAVVRQIDDLGGTHMIQHSVSCSETRGASKVSHCGQCFQCVDRRLAVYACGPTIVRQDADYCVDLATELLPVETRVVALDYVRQARGFALFDSAGAFGSYASDVADVVDGLGGSEEAAVRRVANLLHAHHVDVGEGLKNMRLMNVSGYGGPSKGTLLKFVEEDYYNSDDNALRCAVLKQRLCATKPGHSDAKSYERLVRDIWQTLFDSCLTAPNEQAASADRREIVDLTFRNKATVGFWSDLKIHQRTPLVIVEIKNMEALGNPEFAQLCDRLGPARGHCGFLVCRQAGAKEAQLARRRLANGKQVIVVDDTNMRDMLDMYSRGDDPAEHLAELQRRLIEES